MRKGWFPNNAPDRFKTLRDELGNEAYVSDRAEIHGKVRIGSFSYISGSAFLFGEDPIYIGSFCSIGDNFYCSTAENHQTDYPSAYPFSMILGMEMAYSHPKKNKRPYVRVGSDVWIGSDVKVMGGLVLGDGCVVGTRSLVTKDLEPYGLYAGVPAKLIRFRFREEIIRELLEIRWWDWPIGKIQQNRKFLNLDLNTFCGTLTDVIV